MSFMVEKRKKGEGRRERGEGRGEGGRGGEEILMYNPRGMGYSHVKVTRCSLEKCE